MNNKGQEIKDVLIVDSGGGMCGTITNRAWKILERTNELMEVHGYLPRQQSRTCPIVNATTTAKIPNRDEEVVILMNHVTYLNDSSQTESLLQPFQANRHGVRTDLTPFLQGGKQSMVVEDVTLPFEFDGEKMFWNIRKPSQHNLDRLE
ncbi:MAG: hypothetical protein ACREOZ_03095, partial [Gloeomargaritales cyanobacterium]